jgi:hypothetical protein
MSVKRPWLDEDDKQLRSLALSGFSLTEISEQMQRGINSVRNRAMKLDIALARDRNSQQTPVRRRRSNG